MEKEPNKKVFNKKFIINLIAGAIGFVVGYALMSWIL